MLLIANHLKLGDRLSSPLPITWDGVPYILRVGLRQAGLHRPFPPNIQIAYTDTGDDTLAMQDAANLTVGLYVVL